MIGLISGSHREFSYTRRLQTNAYEGVLAPLLATAGSAAYMPIVTFLYVMLLRFAD